MATQSACPPPVTHNLIEGQFRRKKIWQLDEKFLCFIVGNCFTSGELRHLAHKAKIPIEVTRSDHELYRAFLEIIHRTGPGARLVQKHLDRKYDRIIQQFSSASSNATLAELWNTLHDRNKMVGAFWALVTHPLTFHALVDQGHREVVMLSYIAANNVRMDVHKFRHLQKRSKTLCKELTAALTYSLWKMREKEEAIQAITKRLDKALAAKHELENQNAVSVVRTLID